MRKTFNNPAPSAYRRLEVERIKLTNQKLCQRIHERFPDANLGKVCQELDCMVDNLKQRAAWIARPNLALRIPAIIMAVGIIVLSVFYTSTPIANLLAQPLAGQNFLQTLEAVMSGIFLLGLLLVFLVTLEQRIKRNRALKALHELRALAHVVDMHQLTKDPSYFLNRAERTKSSPNRNFSAFELVRYLDYCGEMLSIIGKLAAYYAQHFHDPVLYDAVNDVESLTNDLTRKIWQKIAVLHEYQQDQEQCVRLPAEFIERLPPAP